MIKPLCGLSAFLLLVACAPFASAAETSLRPDHLPGLRKLLDHALITRSEHPGRIVRVEYRLTSTGKRLAALIEQIRDLDEEHAQGSQAHSVGSKLTPRGEVIQAGAISAKRS